MTDIHSYVCVLVCQYKLDFANQYDCYYQGQYVIERWTPSLTANTPTIPAYNNGKEYNSYLNITHRKQCENTQWAATCMGGVQSIV